MALGPKILVYDTFSGRLGTEPPSNPTLVGLHVGTVACADVGGIVTEFAADLSSRYPAPCLDFRLWGQDFLSLLVEIFGQNPAVDGLLLEYTHPYAGPRWMAIQLHILEATHTIGRVTVDL